MNLKRKRVEFKILAPKAKHVLLSGNFNNWSSNSDPMKRNRGGTWIKIKQLPKGTYEYKFIVDGQWLIDPDNYDTVQNQHGTTNSVIVV